ncbi:MAG: 30S ribosome-binding factor RbfA [Arcobacter sp.]|jgi:ribosome-binding factor A|uniref:Ribosome-binding factor A n=1 Tax=Arcobacter defluvii TaxID=873191 RepID=A0AAE7E847_9BACT|nr:MULTISPECIES: 30S ribosome-binding factor RbfA [Arcobacter]MDY3200537.1 30S ribosome-binding factor RbfA [Arcobacter sp.]QKF78649.1 ribosome-binding factor A [Arcobacter defluvii]RXI34037.1 30S ribosome-binding factor RbfA [Arcobacter defluvii]BAK74425.1 ribosome-binding factor A [Arcobacter sp. L]
MKSINLQRTESLLMELIPEALSNLADARINSLPITGINCKNGKYDAIVYFDGSDYDKNEIKEIISSLIKANGRLKTHILASTGWYKCPNFTFVNDTSLEKSKHIEDLFAQIRKTTKSEE